MLSGYPEGADDVEDGLSLLEIMREQRLFIPLIS